MPAQRERYLPDVNIFVDAFRTPGPCRSWLETSRANRERILILPEVAASTIRILTNPRIWGTPAPSRDVHRLFGQLMRTPDTALAQAPLNTWRTFTQIVESLDLSGNDIPDAWLAASSHTLNATLVTRDIGFVKFPDLTVTYLSNNS